MKDLTPPRYLVIADYPNSHYEIGQIIELSVPKDASGWDMVTLANNEEIMPKYPHLFRLLHWSECLTEETIPQYVKNIQSKKIYRVRNFHKTDMKAYDINGKFMNLKLYLPATLSEYNEYIKTK